jgi:hypothetical protein
MVSVLALAVTVGVKPKVTAPLPRFNALLPVKVKLLPQVCGLLFASVINPPEVLSMVGVPLIANTPAAAPSAVALLMFKGPPVKLTPPLKLLFPLNVSAAAPLLLRLLDVLSAMFPLSVIALALTMLAGPPSVTAPVKVAPVALLYKAPPEPIPVPTRLSALVKFVCASTAAPLATVIKPVPAAAAFVSNCNTPAFTFVPPE